MNDIDQDEDRLKAKINFREVDVPCCGKCKWFEREYEDTMCRHPQTQRVWFWGGEAHCGEELYPSEHNVCDLFETGEYHYGEENEYWTRKIKKAVKEE